MSAPTRAPVFDYAGGQFGLSRARTDCPASLALYDGPNLLSEAFFAQGIPPSETWALLT